MHLGRSRAYFKGVLLLPVCLGRYFFGRVFDVTHSYNLALYISSAISAVAIPATFLLRLPYRSPQVRR